MRVQPAVIVVVAMRDSRRVRIGLTGSKIVGQLGDRNGEIDVAVMSYATGVGQGGTCGRSSMEETKQGYFNAPDEVDIDNEDRLTLNKR